MEGLQVTDGTAKPEPEPHGIHNNDEIIKVQRSGGPFEVDLMSIMESGEVERTKSH